jgi:hypothetical protein
MAKYSGSGWHHQSVRHSNARKYGRAGGQYARKWISINNTKIKGKRWITKELSDMHGNTILVYDDRKAGFGWRVWVGKTDGSDKGKYLSFETKEVALAFAEGYSKGLFGIGKHYGKTKEPQWYKDTDYAHTDTGVDKADVWRTRYQDRDITVYPVSLINEKTKGYEYEIVDEDGDTYDSLFESSTSSQDHARTPEQAKEWAINTAKDIIEEEKEATKKVLHQRLGGK